MLAFSARVTALSAAGGGVFNNGWQLGARIGAPSLDSSAELFGSELDSSTESSRSTAPTHQLDPVADISSCG
jgi:hypothetical protein